MRILVTGAGGFVGRHLIDALVECGAHEVHQVVRSGTSARQGVPSTQTDLSRQGWTDDLPDASCDCVVHLAQSARFREFPAGALDVVRVNVGATVELADWARRHEVRRFVFASTGNVYGLRATVSREDDPCDPRGLYASSKRSAELLLEPFAPSFDVLVLRLFGVYGPGQTKAMLPTIMERFDLGDEVTLAAGIGVRYNPLYIDDCVRILADLFQQEPAEAFGIVNVGGFESVDLKHAIELLEGLTGKRANVRITDGPAVELVGSVDKLARICRVRPEVRFRDGFIRMYRASRSTASA